MYEFKTELSEGDEIGYKKLRLTQGRPAKQPMKEGSLKVAFVHDWLVTYRGGERVLEAMLELYPEAPIYTLFYERKNMPALINSRNIITPKYLKKMQRIRKALLPIYPILIESFPLEKYDLVISTSSCVAKGVITGPNTKHISYIHSPMRYIWDQREHYAHSFHKVPGGRLLFATLSSMLRMWDVTSTNRVSKLIANSRFVAKRINNYYNREATVIHPPIELAKYGEGTPTKAPYYLLAGAFVSYKRFELAIEACNRMNLKLIVAGSGPMEDSWRKLGGSNTEFIINPDDTTWINLLQKAKALIFPGVEDFGMTAIEAMAAGTPVIALKRGGALDFIEEGVSGVFFKEPTVESLVSTIKIFEQTTDHYKIDQLRRFSDKFSKQSFMDRFKCEVDKLIAETTV